MKQLVTVFTPLFNRKDLLGRLYESLRAQTCRRFEWLICDDCSTDGSWELAVELAAKEKSFPIRVIRAEENGGKHRAINRGLPLAEGFLFFIVDSDDALTPDAIGRILSREPELRRDPTLAGLGFLKADLSGRPVGTTFAEEFLDCTSLEREKHRISGDKAEVLYTEVMARYPFPEFPGENFLTEGVVWDRIAHDGWKLRWINEVIYLCEYQPEGLSAHWERNLANNPRGYALWQKQKMDFLSLTGYDRFRMVYGYYYTMSLAGDYSVKAACRMLSYPVWKGYLYLPVRKAGRVLHRIFKG